MLEIKIASDGSRTFFVDGVEVPEGDAMRIRDDRAAAEQTVEGAVFSPLVPLPISGATIEEIKVSADAAIADLAYQMENRLVLIMDNHL